MTSNLLSLSKADYAELRWVQRAAATGKDAAPTLRGICCDGAWTIAADGDRAHIVKRPLLPEGLWKLDGKPSARYRKQLHIEPCEGHFPDVRRVIPDIGRFSIPAEVLRVVLAERPARFECPKAEVVKAQYFAGEGWELIAFEYVNTWTGFPRARYGMNLAYLQDALAGMPDGFGMLFFDEPTRPCLVDSAETQSVIMPMLLTNEVLAGFQHI